MSNAQRRQPEQQAPPVQRLQVRYAKRGRARFTSHRDFSRAFERALRRAGVPMAYSSGFTPHPRISFANASPTGAASEAEYLEIALRERDDPERVRAALTVALPDGLDVLAVVEGRGGSLAEKLTASSWLIRLDGVAEEDAAAAVASLLARDRVEVQRMTKTGMRTFDARAAIICLAAAGDTVHLVVGHQTPLVRPDDVVSALRGCHAGFSPREVPVLTRLAQGTWDGSRIVEPLEDSPGA